MQFRQLKERLNNSHLLSLITNGSMAALGIITYAVLCRVLSLGERGAWLLFQSTFFLVECMRNGFLATGFVKAYAGTNPEKAREIAGSAWFISGVISFTFLLLSIPSFFFSGLIQDEGLALFAKWFGVVSVASLPFFMATCLTQAENRFDRLLKLRIINQLLFIGCILLAHFFFEDSPAGIVHAFTISFLISSLFAISAGWTQLKSVSYKKWEHVRNLYHFGKYTVGTTLCSNLFVTIEAFVINFLLGPAALAICDIATKLLELIEIPMRSLASSGLPILSAAYNNGKPGKVIRTMKKLTGVLTVLIIPPVILAVIFAEVLISLIGGGKYVHTDAINLFRIFILFAILNPADRFMALTLDAVNRPRVNFIKVLVMLAVTLVAGYLGIYFTGSIFGYAYASVLPVASAILISYLALQHYRKFSFWDIYRVGYRETLKGMMVLFKR